MNKKVCSKCKEEKLIEEFSDKYRICTPCKNKTKQKYRRSIFGLIKRIYYNHTHTMNRDVSPATYSFKEFYLFIINQPNFNNLYINWVINNYDRYLTPSCDRINENLGYSLDNIQLVTWKINEERGFYNRKSGHNNKINREIHQYTLDNILIKKYYSQAQASRETKIPQANINKCANGLRKTAGNYIWKHGN
jgi:hypothetical protein